MNRREREVMDMLDAGVAVRRVALLTKLSPTYIRQIRATFDFDGLGRQEQRQQAAVRASTMALEAAILATGKRHS